jgi:hypothetical protein
MSDGAQRHYEFHGKISGSRRVLPADTNLVSLVAALPNYTLCIQRIHVEVIVPTGGEVWTFQDGNGVPIVPSVSAAAVAHFDYDFGPDGVPCTNASAFLLNITGATGASGWISWDGFKAFTLTSVDPYATLVIRDGALAYWRLDEASGLIARDRIGGNNGTISGGVTLNQPGALAGDAAMAFDGTSSKIIAPVIAFGTAFTVEWWVKTSSVALVSCVSNRLTGAVGGLFGLTGGKTYVYIQAFTLDLSGSRFIADGIWHHVAITRTGATTTYFVDGVVDQSQTGAGTIDATNPVLIAADALGAFFPGILDEVAIYQTALTPAQILAHYQAAPIRSYAEQVVADGAIAYWRLDETSGTLARDSIGTNNGTISGGVTLNQPGAIPGHAAMAFDNISGVITCGTFAVPVPCSFEAWIKTTDTITQPILTNYTAGVNGGLYFGTNTGRTLLLYSVDSGNFLGGTALVATGSWVHVVATNDGTTTKFYVNGVLDTTAAQVVSAVTHAVEIGRSVANPVDYWNGLIDEVAIYPTVLTAAQILAHYQTAQRG